MDANWWNQALQSYDIGREHRADRENAEAFQTGGYGAVEQTAGARGDLRTAMTTRRFQDDQRQQAYERMETIAPWARNAVRATRNMDPQRARMFLEQNQQRFLDFGFTPEQVAAGIAGLTSENPEERTQWADTLDQAFSQHQNPDWQLATVPTEDGQGLEQRFIAPDVSTGAVQRGEGSIPVPPGEVQSFGSGGLYRNNQNSPNGYEVLREPRSVAAGGGGAQYRPITPEEAQAYGLPGNGDGFVMGSNGLPRRVGGGGTFPADQRARVAISYEPALEAAQYLERADAQAVQRQGTHGSNTPIGQDWGARILEAVPFDGGSAARWAGGEDYQLYTRASSAFEAAMLPILSGAAVTESEAQRIVRAALPRMNDSQETLATKARQRRQMLNGAALIGGRPPPFPQDGVADWAQRALSAPSEGLGLESLSDEQLDALEQELMNGGR